MVSKKSTLSFDIPISEWARQLEKVSSAAYVEVLDELFRCGCRLVVVGDQ